jgi:predicted phosphate transport protein (TIGR00153 family)
LWKSRVRWCNGGVTDFCYNPRTLAFRLIPTDGKFYDDFQALAEELERGAKLLEAMLAPEKPIWDKAEEIKEVEHKCDFLTHEIIQRLNRTFVTPLDREDIHALARSLDDVMDSIDACATVVRLYRLDTVRAGARELAQIITTSTEQVRLALRALEQHKGLKTHAIEINRLENEADRVHQHALSRLFDEERDPIAVIKWKETLDFLENATDRCEDVANVLEGVMVKHG